MANYTSAFLLFLLIIRFMEAYNCVPGEDSETDEIHQFLNKQWSPLLIRHNPLFYSQFIDTSKLFVDRAPFVALIFVNGTRRCTATIIHERFLITTATCCSFSPVKKVRIKVGTVDDRYGKVLNVSSFIISNQQRDMCLIKLNKPLEWTAKIEKVDLPIRKINNHVPGLMYGWGHNLESHRLQRVLVYYIQNGPCEERLKKLVDSFESCGSGELSNRIICGIESGAPLIISGILVGMASRNLDCTKGTFKQPLILTDIFESKRHILDTIKKELQKP